MNKDESNIGKVVKLNEEFVQSWVQFMVNQNAALAGYMADSIERICKEFEDGRK